MLHEELFSNPAWMFVSFQTFLSMILRYLVMLFVGVAVRCRLVDSIIYRVLFKNCRTLGNRKI